MTEPLKPYDDRESASLLDHSGGYSLYALQRMLNDCADQPNWRMRADIACAYYDGKQLSAQQKELIRMEGLDERAINLIRPVINGVLGEEAKSRTDVRIECDDDEYQDVCDALNPRLKEAEREACAHMAVSNGYASGTKAGVGWVEVARNPDPLAYPYIVQDVPRDEIWWDWRGQKGVTLDACRWVTRMRFVDLDEAEASFPEHKDILNRCVNGWSDIATEQYWLGEPDAKVVEAFENERRFSISRHNWVNSARKMVKFYEVWYKVPAQVVVLHLGPTRRVLYDEKDPRHVEAVARGLVKVSKAISMQVRMALFAGPHRILDKATTRRKFPFYPFFAFRDDADKSPYGLIDGMIAPQDDYNERRLRIQWMLKARQVQMDSDALDPDYNTIADIADGIMRPDLVTITNPNRMNKAQGVIARNDLTMQPEQFKVLEDSKQLIQDTAGRYSSQLGNAQVQSGIANSLLIEQGQQAMGEMNDNYVHFRRQVFEGLLDLIIEDHASENLQVKVGSGSSRRVIVLNSWDQATGQPVNMVKDANAKVGMAEVPATPAYRQQTLQQVANIITALGNNPAAMNILAPAYIENSMLDNRKVYADAMRKATGIPNPADKDGQAQADAMQQQALQKKMQLEEQMAQASVQDKAASAEQKAAAARLAHANAAQIEQRVASGAAVKESEATVQLDLAKAEQAMQSEEDRLIQEALDEAMTA